MAARGWKIQDLAQKSDVTYEVVRRMVHGLSSSSVENTNKVLVAVDREFAIVPRIA